MAFWYNGILVQLRKMPEMLQGAEHALKLPTTTIAE